MTATPKYHRVLLKLSGEALLGDRQFGISPQYTAYLAEEIRKVYAFGVQIGVVLGGGNWPYIRLKAISHLEKGRIVIFAAGTGNPFFTSDTAAALRSAEIDAEVILMGKNKVDGVYSGDPRTDKNAKKYDDIGYRDLLEKRLGIMDATAAALAEDRKMPTIVFDVSEKDAMVRAVLGEHVGTLVHAG